MKALFAKYLNEILGLTIMVLMASALVAGQADAEVRKVAVQQPVEVAKIELSISARP